MSARKLRPAAIAAVALLLAATACVSQGKRGAAVTSPEPRPEPRGAAATAPVVVSVPGEPTVAVKIWFRVGSQDDPPGKEGLAFLTGRLISDGSTTRLPYEQILERLYPMAASYGVRVDKEMTTLTGRTHRDTLDEFLALYADAFARPAFTSADFERIKSNTLNYLESTLRYASDEELGKAALAWLVYGGTRYAHPPQGTLAGVRSITPDDVARFYREHYTRGNAVVGLAGDAGPDLVARLQEEIASLPAGAPAAVPPPKSQPIRGRRVLLVSKPGADASISFGFPLDVHRGERDFYALSIANSWLGEHRKSSSHLYDVIRDARGLNYGDYSYIEAFPEGGMRQQPPPNVGRRSQMFEVWIRTLPNENAVFALRAALRELTRLIDTGLTQEQFDLTRSFLDKYSLHYATTPTERLGYAVDDRFYRIGGEGHLALFRKMMREMTRDEVNAAIRKHLQAGDLAIAIVTGQPDLLRKQLTSSEPTPITYPTPKPDPVLAEDKEIAAFPLGILPEDVTVVPVDQFLQ